MGLKQAPAQIEPNKQLIVKNPNAKNTDVEFRVRLFHDILHRRY